MHHRQNDNWSDSRGWLLSFCLTLHKFVLLRLMIKAPAIDRKDKVLPGVIISEKKDEAIRKHQASTLPFPYTSVGDMEAVLAQPIGKEWLPHQVRFWNFCS